MPVSRSLLRLGAVTTALTLTGAGVAFAALSSTATGTPAATDGAFDSAAVASHGTHKHGGQAGHLPGSATGMRLVGQQRINQDVEGRVADVAVHKGYAYLAAFNERDCQKGGVYVFDIRKPQSPKQINFIRTANNSYVGEGSQTISIATKAFTGDLLIHNNEICAGGGNAKGTSQAIGGVSLVDVTNPKTHKVLAAGVGDVPVGGTVAHTVHSAFAWQPNDEKAYAVIVDNEESTDVDILDISDPRKPVLIAEYDLNTEFPQIIDAVKGDSESFLHDMVVKKIGDKWVMLASYWDGGYVTLDITDPMEPVYVADSDFAKDDEQLLEQTGDLRTPEGNAHQAEFSTDPASRYVLAADEDFAPYSLTGTNLESGASISAASGDQTLQLAAGQAIEGTTVFTGQACSTAGLTPASAGSIAVIERGVCTFTEKVATAETLGYAAALIVNRNGANACETTGGMSVEGGIPAFGIAARSLAYDLFDIAGYSEAECVATPDATAADAPTPLPIALGTVGDVVSFESYFDGWGYVRLFENGTGKLKQLDTFAIGEAFDEDKAVGFGDLSVHEIAFSEKDPTLAYVSYYAGGTRVLRIVDGEIVDSGHWIDADGSNVWGVQVFQSGGKEYVAASDRDFGLQIFEYTGTGKVN